MALSQGLSKMVGKHRYLYCNSQQSQNYSYEIIIKIILVCIIFYCFLGGILSHTPRFHSLPSHFVSVIHPCSFSPKGDLIIKIKIQIRILITITESKPPRKPLCSSIFPYSPLPPRSSYWHWELLCITQ